MLEKSNKRTSLSKSVSPLWAGASVLMLILIVFAGEATALSSSGGDTWQFYKDITICSTYRTCYAGIPDGAMGKGNTCSCGNAG